MRWFSGLFLLIYVSTISFGQDRSTLIREHAERAREALAEHDLPRANREYQEVLKLDPQNAEIHAAQGAVLYGMGRAAEAMLVLRTALKLNPNQQTAELFLGLSEAESGHCSQALPLLRKHFSSETDAKLRRLVGLSLFSCHITGSQLDSALELGHTLRNAFPGDPDVLYHLAGLYSRLWSSAVSELVQKVPDSFRVHQLAGEALEAQGKSAQAVKEYLKALEMNPRAPRLHYRLGRLFLVGGDREADPKAMAHFQQELSVNPGDVASEYEIAEIFRRSQEHEKARTHYLRALAISPEFADARVGLAKVYSAEQQPELARQELEQAIQHQPENSAARYALSLVFRDLGKLEEAQRELAIFTSLESRKAKDFNTLLQTLLSGKPSDR
jgi:tetratricopeptide (TPR) repeat protein